MAEKHNSRSAAARRARRNFDRPVDERRGRRNRHRRGIEVATLNDPSGWSRFKNFLNSFGR